MPDATLTALNIDHSKVRTYQVALDWVRENGVLVTPHVYGVGLLTVQASLTELGLRESDPRAKRLKGLRRKLVGPHLCAHHVDHRKGETILGYSPDLPPPPAVYFAKVNRLLAIEYLTPAGWLPLPVQPYQLEAAADDDAGVVSRWLNLAGDFAWPVVERGGQPGRWLRLIWDGEKVRDFSDKDLTVDPANNIAALESRARASVDMNNAKGVKGYGQKLVGYGGYAWIGFKAWAAWQRDWRRYEAEMDCLKAYILWRYPEFQADISAELERIADLAWQALRRKVGKVYLADLGGDVTPDQADFIDLVVQGGLSRLPSPETIQSKLRLDFEVALVQAESDVERDRLAAEQLRAERAEAQARQQAAAEWVEAESRQARAVADRVETEQQAMRRAALDKARQQIEEAGSPLQQMADNLRHTVYQKMREAQRGLQERGSLHPKTVQGLRLLVEQFSLLNSHGDDELERQLQAFEKMMPAAGGVRDESRLADIKALAGEITALTRAAAERVMERSVADDFGTEAVRW
ncbi:MAG: hypothetical protein FOGNACKC_06107 [Anaerolineae bacterium]|nr:hypothetical protein [Anaerolineae bacterium]